MGQKLGDKPREGKVQVTTLLKTRAEGEICYETSALKEKKSKNFYLQGDTQCCCSKSIKAELCRKTASERQAKH